MKKALQQTTLFASLYFVVIAVLYYIGTFSPNTPSLLHSDIVIPVTIIYAGLFFLVLFIVKRKKLNP